MSAGNFLNLQREFAASKMALSCSSFWRLVRFSFSTVSCASVTLLVVDLKEQPSASTLAQKLGDTAHVSGLAIRLARVSGASERLAEWLLKVAIERGARHYERDFDPALPPDNPAVSDEQIGVALCLGQHRYALDQLRVAAQLLSSPRVDAERLCQLAIHERVEPVLLHIAAIAEKFAPDDEPWANLRRHLRPRRVPRADALPHWTRLVSYTGISSHGGPPHTDWLRRRE